MLNTTFEHSGDTLTVKPDGELDSMTSPVFEQEFRQHLSGEGSIIVDCEKLRYISSAGLRVFLTIEKDRGVHGGEMKLIHVNEQILEIFDMVGFTDVVTVE